MVPALTPHQRPSGVLLDLFHPAHQNNVVAGLNGVFRGAGHACHCALNQRNAAPSFGPLQALEP